MKYGQVPVGVLMSEALDLSTLGLATVTEYGVHFETGKPVTFEFLRNTEKAPNVGARFGQDIEPAGRYMTHRYGTAEPPRGWVTGTATFKRPLVLVWNTGAGGYDDAGWKARLAVAFKAKRKALTSKLVRAGFDGIVTVDKRGTSEVVSLSATTTREGLGTKVPVGVLVQESEQFTGRPVTDFTVDQLVRAIKKGAHVRGARHERMAVRTMKNDTLAATKGEENDWSPREIQQYVKAHPWRESVFNKVGGVPVRHTLHRDLREIVQGWHNMARNFPDDPPIVLAMEAVDPLVNEVSFTAAAPTSEWRGNTATFVVDDTDYRVRVLPRDGQWLQEVVFEAQTPTGWTTAITGTGNPIKVLSSVISAVVEYVYSHGQIKALMFVAKGRGRTRTYEKMAKLMARKFTWKVGSEVAGDHGVFALAKNEEALEKALRLASHRSASLSTKWATRSAEKQIAAMQATTARLRAGSTATMPYALAAQHEALKARADESGWVDLLDEVAAEIIGKNARVRLTPEQKRAVEAVGATVVGDTLWEPRELAVQHVESAMLRAMASGGQALHVGLSKVMTFLTRGWMREAREGENALDEKAPPKLVGKLLEPMKVTMLAKVVKHGLHVASDRIDKEWMLTPTQKHDTVADMTGIATRNHPWRISEFQRLGRGGPGAKLKPTGHGVYPTLEAALYLLHLAARQVDDIKVLALEAIDASRILPLDEAQFTDEAKEPAGAKRARKLVSITQKGAEKETAAGERHRASLAKIRQATDDAKRKTLMTTENVNDRSEDETVVEYAVRELFKRPTKTTVAAAAKATAKKLSGGENLFLGGGVVVIDPKKLEGSIWKRVAEYALKSNLDSAIAKFGLYDAPANFRGPKSMKHREAIRAAAKKLKGHDPFPPDMSEAVLTEAAKGIADLPSGVTVRVKVQDEDSIQVMYWTPLSAGTGRRSTALDGAGGVIMLGRDKRRYGNCDDAFMVEWSEAVKGWGPLLYDVCVEVTTKLGGGLMSDRRSVSDDAHKVWMYYMSRRPDVKVHQLDDIEPPHLTGTPSDDCEQVAAKQHLGSDPKATRPEEWTRMPESKRITKDNPTTLRALALADRLVLNKGLAAKLKVTLVPAG